MSKRKVSRGGSRNRLLARPETNPIYEVKQMTNSTIKYYNDNAKTYCANTIAANVSELYKPFLEHLASGAKILDAGCGSGRDSLFFMNQGFSVTAFDASTEMVKAASALIGQEVLLMTFENLKLAGQYDGIWACSSLLHVNRNGLLSVLRNLSDALKPTGVFYMSFKYGNEEYQAGDRYFNCMTEESFRAVISRVPELRIDLLCVTEDVRPGRETELWLNAYLVKE